MTKKTLKRTILLIGLAAQSLSVSGWNKGGFTDDPNNPKYATHDWIAQHTLDWLPPAHRSFTGRRFLDSLKTRKSDS